jgi:hypothetical protein
MDSMESILTSIKKLLGIMEDDDSFDDEIKIHINATFLELSQIGLGPEEGFMITDDKTTWKDFIPDNVKLQSAVKTLTYLKVKLIFDPPLSGSLLESINKSIDRYEWRISVEVELQNKQEGENQNG